MRGHGLCVFERAAGFKIRGDSGRSKCVAADADPCAEIGGAALDYAPSIDAVHRVFRQRAGAAGGWSGRVEPSVVRGSGGIDIGIKVGFEIVVRRHLMALAAAFLMKAD